MRCKKKSDHCTIFFIDTTHILNPAESSNFGCQIEPSNGGGQALASSIAQAVLHNDEKTADDNHYYTVKHATVKRTPSNASIQWKTLNEWNVPRKQPSFLGSLPVHLAKAYRFFVGSFHKKGHFVPGLTNICLGPLLAAHLRRSADKTSTPPFLTTALKIITAPVTYVQILIGILLTVVVLPCVAIGCAFEYRPPSAPKESKYPLNIINSPVNNSGNQPQSASLSNPVHELPPPNKDDAATRSASYNQGV